MPLADQTYARLDEHLATRWGVTRTAFSQRTLVFGLATRNPASWDELWALHHRSLRVIVTHPQRIEHYQGADIDRLMQHPDNARDHFYTVDASTFHQQTSIDGISVRRLTAMDSAAFAAFKERCPQEDQAQGQVGLDDEAIFGALDGARIVAAASSFDWRGFVDVGVLTDPDYRRRGLGATVIAALTDYHLNLPDETRLPLYRHEATNRGSRGVARRCGYVEFATVDFIKPA